MIPTAGTTHERVENGWWCDLHGTIHLGDIQGFSMEHRVHLHPVYAHVNQERRGIAQRSEESDD